MYVVILVVTILYTLLYSWWGTYFDYQLVSSVYERNFV